MSIEPHQTTAALSLTEDEVLRLLEDKGPATLVEITGKIAGAYSGQALKNNEAMAAEQIFRLLMRETELRVRVSLAEQIKNSQTIPHDIVMALARDVEAVALPILQHSEVLSDADLIELVNSTPQASRHLAVSRREHVSDHLSDTLIAKGNEEVTSSLVHNSGAEISESGLKTIVEQHTENKTLMNALIQRQQLPATVAEKLITVVSSSLASTLKEKYHLPAEEIEHEVEKTRESETLGLIRITSDQQEIDRLVNQLIAFDRLSPSIILSALCQGNFCFFETSLARLSHINVSNARALINDKGDLGFRAVYNKSGLPDAMFPAVRTLLRAVKDLDEENEKPGTNRYANRLVERILHYAETNPVDNLSYIIALVRRVAQ
jgi:uncharacterized protein (DUF2336 family)